jgi:hypothetical protein
VIKGIGGVTCVDVNPVTDPFWLIDVGDGKTKLEAACTGRSSRRTAKPSTPRGWSPASGARPASSATTSPAPSSSGHGSNAWPPKLSERSANSNTGCSTTVSGANQHPALRRTSSDRKPTSHGRGRRFEPYVPLAHPLRLPVEAPRSHTERASMNIKPREKNPTLSADSTSLAQIKTTRLSNRLTPASHPNLKLRTSRRAGANERITLVNNQEWTGVHECPNLIGFAGAARIETRAVPQRRAPVAQAARLHSFGNGCADRAWST